VDGRLTFPPSPVALPQRSFFPLFVSFFLGLRAYPAVFGSFWIIVPQVFYALPLFRFGYPSVSSRYGVAPRSRLMVGCLKLGDPPPLPPADVVFAQKLFFPSMKVFFFCPSGFLSVIGFPPPGVGLVENVPRCQTAFSSDPSPPLLPLFLATKFSIRFSVCLNQIKCHLCKSGPRQGDGLLMWLATFSPVHLAFCSYSSATAGRVLGPFLLCIFI